MIKEMQNSIVTKLKADITDLAVEACPDNPNDYRLKHSKGAVLVQYQGAKFSDVNLELNADLNAEFLNTPGAAKYEFAIVLLMRSLRGNTGVYAALDLVRASLIGFVPTGATELLPDFETFIGQKDGVWSYKIMFQTID